MTAHTAEQLLEELTLASANMLARVRMGGGAREQLHEAVERTNRYFELRRLEAGRARHVDCRGEAPRPVTIIENPSPTGPDFAPPDAVPAHERVIVPATGNEEQRPVGRAAAYKD